MEEGRDSEPKGEGREEGEEEDKEDDQGISPDHKIKTATIASRLEDEKEKRKEGVPSMRSEARRAWRAWVMYQESQ